MHRCEPDQEFLLQFNKMGEAVKSAELASKSIGDTKMVNYYRGIWRGIQMAQEAYWTCWGITIQDQVEVNTDIELVFDMSKAHLFDPSTGETIY